MNSIVEKGFKVIFCFEKKMIHSKGMICNDNEQNEGQLLAHLFVFLEEVKVLFVLIFEGKKKYF